MKILIIEDDEAIRHTLQFMLELNGHTVDAAADGPEGLKLAETRPDLILCDVGLPGMSGYEVIGEVQKIAACRDVPFIFLTARADRDDQRRGMALGADDYITKPFTENDILEAIAARTRRHATLRERVEQALQDQRREMSAAWSHELMTPLAGVLGGLSLIESEAESIRPEELKELLALIRAGAERQERLSRKLIRFYELERLKANPSERDRTSTQTDIAILAAASRAAEANARTADLEIDCASALVALNEAYLGDAITELVDNACRFSRPGQRITVTGAVAGAWYSITVTDRGIGMSAAERARIGPFTQFGRDQREQQGLGLGLAIARSATELVGGRFRLEPGPDQSGLTAQLELPCA